MSEKASSKTLKERVLAFIVDHYYCFGKDIPKDELSKIIDDFFEGLVDELKKKAKWGLEEKMSTKMEGETSVTRFRPRQYVRLDEVLAKLDVKEQKKEKEP